MNKSNEKVNTQVMTVNVMAGRYIPGRCKMIFSITKRSLIHSPSEKYTNTSHFVRGLTTQRRQPLLQINNYTRRFNKLLFHIQFDLFRYSVMRQSDNPTLFISESATTSSFRGYEDSVIRGLQLSAVADHSRVFQ